MNPAVSCVVLSCSKRVFDFSIALLLLRQEPRPQSELRGFCFCRFKKSDRQGASANGPAWAAPKKHRHLAASTVRMSEQPVNEGLLSRGAQVVRVKPGKVNRCVKRAMGLKGLVEGR